MYKETLLFFSIFHQSYSSDIETFYSNCQDAQHYGCYTSGDPDCVSQQSCAYGATWRGSAETEYQFQLIAAASTNKYVAIGFPYTSAMGPAPVVGCSQQFQKPVYYYNTAKYDSLPAYNHSDFVSSYKVVMEDNSTSCGFTMTSNFTMAASNTSGEVSYDLNVNETFIIMAVGPVKDSLMQYHDKKNKTNVSIDLTEHNDFYTKNNTHHNDTGNPIYDNCYQNKGCFGYPDNCVSRRNCDMIVTYTKVRSRAGEERFRFEIGGKVGRDYTAVGLSMDDEMGEDSVMACVHSPAHGNVRQPDLYTEPAF